MTGSHLGFRGGRVTKAGAAADDVAEVDGGPVLEVDAGDECVLEDDARGTDPRLALRVLIPGWGAAGR